MNSIAVVVGVGGMGVALARRLSKEHRILIADFSEAVLDRVATDLRTDGIEPVAHIVDVGSRSSVAGLAAAAAALGPVERVAWTAGLSPAQASADAIIRVDLFGVAYGLDEFGEVIDEGGSGVVIASMAGTMASAQIPTDVTSALIGTATDELASLPFLSNIEDPAAAYGLAKYCNQLRVRAASLTWGRRGARINSISPGVITTAMGNQELAGASGDMMRAMVAASGTGRFGVVDDIVTAANFLLGSEADFITGTDLLVDGGVVAAMQTGVLGLPGS